MSASAVVGELHAKVISEVERLEAEIERYRSALSTINVNAIRMKTEQNADKLRYTMGALSEIAGVVATGGTVSDAFRSYQDREGYWPGESI